MLNLTRAIAAILAVAALALPATGCSSTQDRAALAGLRSLTLSARPTGFAIVIARHGAAVQRHAREHTLSSVRSIQTLHHQPTRNL